MESPWLLSAPHSVVPPPPDHAPGQSLHLHSGRQMSGSAGLVRIESTEQALIAHRLGSKWLQPFASRLCLHHLQLMTAP